MNCNLTSWGGRKCNRWPWSCTSWWPKPRRNWKPWFQRFRCHRCWWTLKRVWKITWRIITVYSCYVLCCPVNVPHRVGAGELVGLAMTTVSPLIAQLPTSLIATTAATAGGPTTAAAATRPVAGALAVTRLTKSRRMRQRSVDKKNCK
jgi:hypothetical protein